MNPVTKAWFESAKMDLDSINLLLEEDHLTSPASFHAQQAVEKCFKAVLEQYKHKIEKTHNLINLYEVVKEYIDIEADTDILITLNDLYLDTRYPGNLGLLPRGKPSKEDALQFYNFAKKIYNDVHRFLKAKIEDDDADELKENE